MRESGENAWKKRIGKTESKTFVTTEHGVVELKLRQKLGEQGERPYSIADRLSALQDSREDWKQRVEEKDVSQFTVEGRLKLEGNLQTWGQILSKVFKCKCFLKFQMQMQILFF